MSSIGYKAAGVLISCQKTEGLKEKLDVLLHNERILKTEYDELVKKLTTPE